LHEFNDNKTLLQDLKKFKCFGWDFLVKPEQLKKADGLAAFDKT
jgi:hypothetical protein